MSRTRSSSIVPYSVEAQTRENLSGLLAVIQATLGGELKYISIYFDSAKKTHVAWFFIHMDDIPFVEKLRRG